MTSLIFGRYWSSDEGDGSSPRAVSRQFLRSSGICASSLIQRMSQKRKKKQVRVRVTCLSIALFFLLSGRNHNGRSEEQNEERAGQGQEQEQESNGMLTLSFFFAVPGINANLVERLGGQVELSGELDKDI